MALDSGEEFGIHRFINLWCVKCESTCQYSKKDQHPVLYNSINCHKINLCSLSPFPLCSTVMRNHLVREGESFYCVEGYEPFLSFQTTRFGVIDIS